MPYSHPEALFEAIENRYESLSKRLQTVARDLPAYRERLALMNVEDLASALGVSTASVVRFAQTFGFKGYSDLKALFQREWTAQINDYGSRIEQNLGGKHQAEMEIVQTVFENNIKGLQDLMSPQLVEALHASVDLMMNARSLWIMASGRSFGSAAYLTYLVQHSPKPVNWLNGLCFNLEGKLHSIGKNDVLIVISYAPYAESSVQAVYMARERGAKIIAITDSPLGEIGKACQQMIPVRDASSYGFRSLVNSVSVIQALFLLYASRAEFEAKEY
ncbi:MAG: MurR/RpiR family transcriptional regulator [Cardiobacteriaceae bacterium]|nr:MurR/RpiR family transcriptional regulator [Cardiobacteriaceae bacterium]